VSKDDFGGNIGGVRFVDKILPGEFISTLNIFDIIVETVASTNNFRADEGNH
jgi:hypothetical protein